MVSINAYEYLRKLHNYSYDFLKIWFLKIFLSPTHVRNFFQLSHFIEINSRLKLCFTHFVCFTSNQADMLNVKLIF